MERKIRKTFSKVSNSRTASLRRCSYSVLCYFLCSPVMLPVADWSTCSFGALSSMSRTSRKRLVEAKLVSGIHRSHPLCHILCTRNYQLSRAHSYCCL